VAILPVNIGGDGQDYGNAETVDRKGYEELVSEQDNWII